MKQLLKNLNVTGEAAELIEAYLAAYYIPKPKPGVSLKATADAPPPTSPGGLAD